jgi:hypothetical protein
MDFWRQHGKPLLGTTSYQEIAFTSDLGQYGYRVYASKFTA